MTPLSWSARYEHPFPVVLFSQVGEAAALFVQPPPRSAAVLTERERVRMAADIREHDIVTIEGMTAFEGEVESVEDGIATITWRATTTHDDIEELTVVARDGVRR